ncbi:D-alanyl-D-alanine carboxypeptidase family protein [Amycolatopsis sp. BJA-103]|uniref:D-alanyl-D-alanine carboxypeptidase family protein n=1 Tax=Amycolatopsis sp. BJA-103 TaxID=1911175 RepID=UPI000C7704D5|nr:peptidase M15 [Amycolatopsis sp. BJA-103]PNE14222.1 peptidase M15 [Amycolatopsis sp. BJA-103]
MVPTTVISSRRTAISVFAALGLVGVAMVALGATGVAVKPIAGKALAVLEEVPGPESGPTCAVDKRYVDEDTFGMRPDVIDAWNALRTKAKAQNITLCVNDGKRSRAQQQREFDKAVERFGSVEQAKKWALQPETSMHVKGIAVDIQPLNSASWVDKNGGALGWCRRYDNEKWHFEYDPAWVTGGCPALLPSATGN